MRNLDSTAARAKSILANLPFQLDDRDSVRRYLATAFARGNRPLPLTLRQQQILEETLTLVLDSPSEARKLCETSEDYTVSEESRELARKMIGVYLARIEALNGEYSHKVRSLRDTIKGIREAEGFTDTEVDEITAVELELFKKPHADAAHWVLTQLKKPSTLGEMADLLLSKGYGAGIERDTLTNSLYVGMNRKPTIFKQDGRLWSLVEWKSKRGRTNEDKK